MAQALPARFALVVSAWQRAGRMMTRLLLVSLGGRRCSELPCPAPLRRDVLPTGTEYLYADTLPWVPPPRARVPNLVLLRYSRPRWWDPRKRIRVQIFCPCG